MVPIRSSLAQLLSRNLDIPYKRRQIPQALPAMCLGDTTGLVGYTEARTWMHQGFKICILLESFVRPIRNLRHRGAHAEARNKVTFAFATHSGKRVEWRTAGLDKQFRHSTKARVDGTFSLHAIFVETSILRFVVVANRMKPHSRAPSQTCPSKILPKFPTGFVCSFCVFLRSWTWNDGAKIVKPNATKTHFLEARSHKHGKGNHETMAQVMTLEPRCPFGGECFYFALLWP